MRGLFANDIVQNQRGNRRPNFDGYGRQYEQNDRCKYCQENHFKSNKCYVNCLYCHSIHLKKNMLAGLCPKMVAFAEEEKKKKSYVCKDCEGEGRFEKTTQIVHRQSQKAYQQRVQRYNNIKKESSQSLSQITASITIPEKRIFKIDKKVEEVTCLTCSGKGRIFRFVDCCKGGCAICNYDQHIINPLWVEERMKKMQHKQQEPFQCAICMQDVGKGSIKFVLECNHEFHLKCISKWLNLQHQKCPICRQVDSYIDFKKLKQLEASEVEQFDIQEGFPPIHSGPIRMQLSASMDGRFMDTSSVSSDLTNLTIAQVPNYYQQQEWE